MTIKKKLTVKEKGDRKKSKSKEKRIIIRAG